MSKTAYTLLAIAIIALCTWFTRAVPYLLFGGKRGVPPLVRRLSATLPEAIMAILVVYCLRGTGISSYANWLPQTASLLLVIFLQVWKKNAMLSIFAGTALHMILIRML